MLVCRALLAACGAIGHADSADVQVFAVGIGAIAFVEAQASGVLGAVGVEDRVLHVLGFYCALLEDGIARAAFGFFAFALALALPQLTFGGRCEGLWPGLQENCYI